jgi:hypothetical protein
MKTEEEHIDPDELMATRINGLIQRCNNLAENNKCDLELKEILNRLLLLEAVILGEIELDDDLVMKLANLQLGQLAFGFLVHFDKKLMLELSEIGHYLRFELLNEPTFI